MRTPASMPAAALDSSSEYQLPGSIPQLDRLRGLAIVMVMICHAAHSLPRTLEPVTSQGWAGVDLFFVLSGFLITGILWDSRESRSYYGRFYGRRVLRIWPVYMLVLFFAFGAIPFLKWCAGGASHVMPNEPIGLWVYLLMIQNLFGSRLYSSPFLSITWSLAIEEQFYLVWPAVIRSISARLAMPCLFSVFLLVPFLRLWAIHCGISPVTIYVNSLTHCDGLLCGAIVALWLRSSKPKRKTLLLTGCALLLTGMALSIASHPLGFSIGRNYSPFLFTAVALISTGLLLTALVSENTGRLLHRAFFKNRTLAFFGFISYGLYLFHLIILRFALSEKINAKLDVWHRPQLTQCAMTICGIGFSILIAWISRVTLERAFLAKKAIFGFDATRDVGPLQSSQH